MTESEQEFIKNAELDVDHEDISQMTTILECPQIDNISRNDILQITNLTKKFYSTTAVDNLSLTMFRGEILVLLGHNGAGKTTTISMLMGELAPTSGSAKAFGKDLFRDQQNLADFIGACPQENVLLEKLTTYQNLYFFCNFKNVEEVEQGRLEEKMENCLESFNLKHKKDT